MDMSTPATAVLAAAHEEARLATLLGDISTLMGWTDEQALNLTKRIAPLFRGHAPERVAFVLEA